MVAKTFESLKIVYTTLKPVLIGPSKKDKTKVLKINGSLMKVESIAECSLGAFCNTFDLHKAIIGLEFWSSFLSGRLRQVLLLFVMFSASVQSSCVVHNSTDCQSAAHKLHCGLPGWHVGCVLGTHCVCLHSKYWQS